jgi:hypothetical protein
MTRIKIVPFATPNADGKWIEVPIDLPMRTRWKTMESLVMPFVPAGHAIVAVERGSQPRHTEVKGPALILR